MPVEGVAPSCHGLRSSLILAWWHDRGCYLTPLKRQNLARRPSRSESDQDNADRCSRCRVIKSPREIFVNSLSCIPPSLPEVPLHGTRAPIGALRIPAQSQIFYRNRDGTPGQLLEHILRRVESGGTGTHYQPEDVFPRFEALVCELPLVAELCVRTGNIEPLFAATAKPTMPTHALAIMMIQLEETIALNWDVFSNEQLGKLPTWLAPLREIAERQTYVARGLGGAPMEDNPHYVRGHESEGKQIVQSIDGITKECQQARYWYLKGTLQRTVNLEVESDKARIEDFLTNLGFSGDMIKALNAAENDYRSANPFELKSCLGHIRVSSNICTGKQPNPSQLLQERLWMIDGARLRATCGSAAILQASRRDSARRFTH